MKVSNESNYKIKMKLSESVIADENGGNYTDSLPESLLDTQVHNNRFLYLLVRLKSKWPETELTIKTNSAKRQFFGGSIFRHWGNAKRYA